MNLPKFALLKCRTLLICSFIYSISLESVSPWLLEPRFFSFFFLIFFATIISFQKKEHHSLLMVLLRNLLTTTSRNVYILSRLVAFIFQSLFGKVRISLHDTNPKALLSLMPTLPTTRINSGEMYFPSTLFCHLFLKSFQLEQMLSLLHMLLLHRFFILLILGSLPQTSPLSLLFWVMQTL